MKTLGVVIGRFQVPQLTAAHIQLLQAAIKQSDDLLVIVGSAQASNTKRNPLPASYRRRMMQDALGALGAKSAIVTTQDDNPSDGVWAAEVEQTIRMTQMLTGCPNYVIFVGDNSGAEKCFNPSVVQRIHSESSAHASDIRDQIGQMDTDQWSSTLASGVVWATQKRFPQVYPTVDIALINPENKKLLLGKKKNEPLWRFPGGFVDPTDDSYLAAAKRELTEEVGLVETSDWKMIGSTKVHDWRAANEQDQSVITTLFSCLYVFGPVIARDDLDQLMWADWTVDSGLLMPEHRPLLAMLRGH